MSITVAPITPSFVAETITLPSLTAVARPSLPAAFETVAITSSKLDQVTCAVRSWVLASE